MALLLMAGLSMQPSASLAQGPGEKFVLADGHYVGSMQTKGEISKDVQVDFQGLGKLSGTWEGNLDGDFDVDVNLGVLDGEWTLEGQAILKSPLDFLGQHFEMQGDQKIVVPDGVITGIATRPETGNLPMQFDFSGTSTTTTTFAHLALPISIPDQAFTSHDPIRLVVTRLEADCTSFTGNWIQNIEEGVENAGLTPRLSGTLYATLKGGADLDQEMKQIKVTQDQGLSLLNTMEAGGAVDRGEFFSWTSDANREMLSIDKLTRCQKVKIEDECKYLSPITDIVGQMADLLVNDEIEFTGETFLPTAVAYAAIGQFFFSICHADSDVFDRFVYGVDAYLKSSFNQEVVDPSDNPSKETLEYRATVYADAAQAMGAENTKEAIRSWSEDHDWGEQ